MTKRAILYARKSTLQDRSEEQSASVADQLVITRAYAEQQGWIVVAEHDDDGKSGLLDRSKRPGLDSALKLIEAGDADVFVTRWTSRLSREERDRAELLDLFDLIGVEWHAVHDGGKIDRSTYAGYIQYGVHTVFDVAYSKRVGENWKRAHERRIEAGLPKTTNPQFGYDYKFDLTSGGRRENGRYVINESEAEAVREVFRRYTRGEGFTPLVRWLNDSGWRVKATGSEWSVRTLSRWMDAGFSVGFISKEKDLRDIRGAHEPIITEAEWLAFQAERERRAPLGKKASGAGERWWLAGFVKCGICGGSTFIDSYERPTSLAVCSTHRANPGACSGTSILRATVERVVGSWLLPHLDALEALTQAETQTARDASAAAYATAVETRDKIRDGLADLEVRRSLGEIEANVFHAAQAKLNARLSKAEAAVADAAVALTGDEPDIDGLRNIADTGWTPDQRAALRGVLDRVELTKEQLVVVPVHGDSVIYNRADLAATCEIFGCDKKHYTKGLCKSHGMRARNYGVLDELAERIAQARENASLTVTLDEVETVLAAARGLNS
ncbi:recombinase family protein [Nocardioides antri]|uniref:Recombinase family protein n=1 Tax=Nocardioides antri TaxID=2607659 RepID=A0A5B1LUX9_9ACTN|nr:recombinase family protein [Nocardioides antri]KAA1424326.1 recombinase family protein [Nocardioides antri]